MRHAKGLAVAVVMAMAGAAFAQEAGDQHMDSTMLRKAIEGKTVNLATPLGGLPINYRHDGTMYGKAGILASYTGSERDRGRWWVVANKLCQRWNTWLGGKSYCFRLRQNGETVHWIRSDGLSGVATITR